MVVTDLIDRLESSWVPIYIVPIGLGIGFAFLDNVGRRMFLQVSNNAEVYSAMKPLYMDLFHGFVWLTIFATTALAYFYYDGDFGDTAAFLVFSVAVIKSGLWDILYFKIQGRSVPAELPWLADTLVGTAADLFNDGVVTGEMLYLNAFLFLVGGLLLAGVLRMRDF